MIEITQETSNSLGLGLMAGWASALVIILSEKLVGRRNPLLLIALSGLGLILVILILFFFAVLFNTL